jgi:probable rRNA maturation factor
VAVEFVVEDNLDATWDQPRIAALVRSLVEPELQRSDYTIALHLVSDDTIRALNQQHRGRDAHTDVLSFPLHDPNGMRFILPPGEPVNLGDVVVSYPRAVEQAREYGHSVDRELGYLVAHGVLHVLGYDHEADAERRVMRRKEEAALAPFGLTRQRGPDEGPPPH